jgi:hypothetical protein
VSVEGDRLRAEADAADEHDRLASAYDTAVMAYRAEPGSEDRRAEYKAAAEALSAWRRESRAGREGVSIGGDATIDPEA